MSGMLEKWFDIISNAKNMQELDDARIQIIGKNGELTKEFSKLATIANEKKRDFAQNLNVQKNQVNTAVNNQKIILEKQEEKLALLNDAIDVSLYSKHKNSGSLHPIMETMDYIIEYFASMNFDIKYGPYVEDDFHNFEALNLPKYHPARDMQDTFYFKDKNLLRTHTSPVQIRTMLKESAPIKMISPGAVFRRDLDLTHTPMFHQVEGLVVGKSGEISFSHLKHILTDFLRYTFGDIEVRFRSSFFPFTEPSAEVDISCIFCESSGCRVCSHTGWLEVLGSGIVDDNVFKAVHYKDCSGYAFGLGIERFAMLLNKIPDLRLMYEGDLRLLKQFKGQF